MSREKRPIRIVVGEEIDLAELSRSDPTIGVGDQEARLVDPGIVERLAEADMQRQRSWQPVSSHEKDPQ